jgi:predicted Zn finger-like uncharacterized protein
MIAACPKCQTRYRVEPERLGPEGARLRCSQCSAVFRVRLPAEHAAPAAEQAMSGAKAVASAAAAVAGVAPSELPARETPREAPHGDSQLHPAEVRPAPRSVESPHDAPHFDHDRLIVIAHPDPDACKQIAETLEREGLQVLVAHDGVEAILSIQRALPRAVVLDAALPKMFGFQVCELIKRNESLRVMQVCLMGAIHRDDRYRRAPSETYGADFYIEGSQLSTALVEWLGRIGFPLRSRPASRRPDPAPELPPQALQSPAPTEAPDPRSQEVADAMQRGVAEPSAPQRSEAPAEAAAERPLAKVDARPARASQPVALGQIGVAAKPLAAERAQAERLARIIVSDIVLYNEAKFSAAVRSGGVLEAMRDELQEGRALFRERIDVAVRDERDFLADELVRVARARGMS